MKPAVPNVLKRHLNVSRYLRLFQMTVHTLKARGLKDTAAKIVRKVRQKAGFPVQPEMASDPFKNGPSKQELRRQKSWSAEPGYRPNFQLALPLEGHSPKAILSTVRSLCRQSYPHWSLLIIADPASKKAGTLLGRFKKADPRIQVIDAADGRSPQNSLHLIQNIASGDYVGLVHEGDKLTADALYEVASAIERQPELDAIYTDEAVLAPKGNCLDRLVLKPDWSPDMLLGYNYLGGLCLFRRSTFERLGGFASQYGSAEEWDLGLKFLEQDCNFKRVPRCCYLRKATPGANPWGTANSENAADSIRVLQDHLNRQGLAADVNVAENGTLRILWRFAQEPLVSIIIPNKDSYRLIRSIVDDLVQRTDYANKEIIIVDNFSQDARVWEFYRRQTELGNIRVVEFNRAFNYSAACNTGARAASGEYLLFMNNDMEVVSREWIHELVGWAQRPQVGVVGTKLLYPGGLLQHCGVVVGLNYVTHLWHKASEMDWGVFGTPNSYRNHLAVTGACQMVRRPVFEEMGGYDERYQIAFSDVAFCLHAWEKGYRVVCTPHASLIHYESFTRDDSDPVTDVQRMASEIRDLNVREDPFFHPGLDSFSFQPTLRATHIPKSRDVLQHTIDLYDPPDESLVPVDLFDEEQLRQIGANCGTGFGHPSFSPRAVADDVREAVKFVLYVLLKDKNARNAFPKALSEGADGEFCRWLCEAGLARYRVDRSAQRAIRKAFLSKPGAAVRNLYSARSDVRQVIPDALIPSVQKRFLHWLLGHRGGEIRLRDEEILWFFLEAAEDPLRELTYSYRVSPTWQQAFPAGLTAFGYHEMFDWLEDRHRLDRQIRLEAASRCREVSLADVRLAYQQNPDWQARFPEAFQDAQATSDLLKWTCAKSGLPVPDWHSSSEADHRSRLSLNVLGHFCDPSPRQQLARCLVESLGTADVDMSLRDMPVGNRNDKADRSEFLGLEVHDVSLIHVEPDRRRDEAILKTAYEKAGLAPRRNVYRIGFSFWELEQVPSDWKSALKSVNELWAPTKFAADTMVWSDAPRVLPMLPGIAIGEPAPVRRADFGVEEDEYLFLFFLDRKSLPERKNPLALIEAYQRAFRKDDRTKLLIKVSSGDGSRAELKQLKRAAGNRGVVLLDKPLSRAKRLGLIQSSDCSISLHRAESFGLPLAEAMRMAKPVIATNYSGNLEYMDETNAMLVDYELRPVRGMCPREVGEMFAESQLWADPSVEHAANWMRWAYEHRDEAAEMGLRGQRHVNDVVSLEAAGRRMKARLAEIYGALREASSATCKRRAA